MKMTIDTFLKRVGDGTPWSDEELDAITELFAGLANEAKKSEGKETIGQGVANMFAHVRHMPENEEELGTIVYTAVMTAFGMSDAKKG